MRAMLVIVLGVLPLLPATAARAAGPREVVISKGLPRHAGLSLRYSSSPYYYRHKSPYYSRYKSPYYYRGGFLSPYVHRTPTYRYFGDRFDRYDRYDGFGTRRYGSFDRFDCYNGFYSPRIHVPRAIPRGGFGDRYHFRGSRNFRGSSDFRGRSDFRGGASGHFGGPRSSGRTLLRR